MALILLAMALLAFYSYVQYGRREQIERVTIAPAPAPSVSPVSSPAPAAP